MEVALCESCDSGECIRSSDGCFFPCDDARLFRAAFEASQSNDPPVSEWACSANGTPCDATAACALEGFCEPAPGNEGSCQIGKGTCTTSAACRDEGRCEVTENGCVAVRDADCSSSTGCVDHDRCFYFEGECVEKSALPDCSADEVVIDGECRFPPDYDCARECKDDDRCGALVTTLREDTFKASEPFVVCVTSAKQCRESETCKRDGLCEPRGARTWSYNKCDGYRFQRCAGTSYDGCGPSDETCADSEQCRVSGDCGATPLSSICRPTKPEHCLQSVGCKSAGACSMVSISGGHVCAPTKKEQCEQSTRCKQFGEGALYDGACDKPESAAP